VYTKNIIKYVSNPISKHITKHILRHIAVILLMLSPALSAAQSDTSEDIFVGVVVSLSGPLAAVGQTMLNGAELARQAINESGQLGGAQLQFIVEDSAGDELQAVAAFERLMADDRIVAILGPVTSSAAAPAFVTAQASGMVAIAPTAAAAGLSTFGDFVFVSTLTLNVLVPNGLTLTQERFGYERVAVIVDEDDLFSQSAVTILEGVFAGSDVEIVASERFSSGITGDIDVREQLERIIASNPDALFIATLPAEATDVLQQAEEVGLSPEVTRITPAFSGDDVAIVGDAAEGLITFSTWDSAADTPGNQAYVQQYRETYGAEPNRFAAQWHAAVTLLTTAIRQADSLESEAIRDALASLQNVDTVLGAFSFDEEGSGVFDPVVLVVRDGVLVPF
jgi:branched-chain amino acid transport system substrate-binding protein